jgi:hypothetical protein
MEARPKQTMAFPTHSVPKSEPKVLAMLPHGFVGQSRRYCDARQRNQSGEIGAIMRGFEVTTITQWSIPRKVRGISMCVHEIDR